MWSSVGVLQCIGLLACCELFVITAAVAPRAGGGSDKELGPALDTGAKVRSEMTEIIDTPGGKVVETVEDVELPGDESARIIRVKDDAGDEMVIVEEVNEAGELVENEWQLLAAKGSKSGGAALGAEQTVRVVTKSDKGTAEQDTVSKSMNDFHGTGLDRFSTFFRLLDILRRK